MRTKDKLNALGMFGKVIVGRSYPHQKTFEAELVLWRDMNIEVKAKVVGGTPAKAIDALYEKAMFGRKTDG